MKHTRAGSRRTLVGIVVIGAIVAGWWLFISRPGPKPPQPPTAPSPVIERRAELEQIFNSHVIPEIQSYQERNLEAVQRCVRRIQSSFEEYRQNIPPFCNEITRLGSRLYIARKMFGDWWHGSNGAGQYVQKTFEKMVVSPQQLTNDIAKALTDFKAEVEANRQNLLSSVKVAVPSSNFPEIVLPNYEEFSQEATKRLVEYFQNKANQNIGNAVATFVASEVATTIAAQIARQALAQVLATMARTAATAGGATAGGAAAGTAGGTAGGPIGIAVGFGAGLVVGALVDWWLTEQFRAKLEAELNTYLDSLETAIIRGNQNAAGVEPMLTEFCAQDRLVVEEIFRQSVLGRGSYTFFGRLGQWWKKFSGVPF